MKFPVMFYSPVNKKRTWPVTYISLLTKANKQSLSLGFAIHHCPYPPQKPARTNEAGAKSVNLGWKVKRESCFQKWGYFVDSILPPAIFFKTQWLSGINDLPVHTYRGIWLTERCSCRIFAMDNIKYLGGEQTGVLKVVFLKTKTKKKKTLISASKITLNTRAE